jgi:hypothetical protein
MLKFFMDALALVFYGDGNCIADVRSVKTTLQTTSTAQLCGLRSVFLASSKRCDDYFYY